MIFIMLIPYSCSALVQRESENSANALRNQRKNAAGEIENHANHSQEIIISESLPASLFCLVHPFVRLHSSGIHWIRIRGIPVPLSGSA